MYKTAMVVDVSIHSGREDSDQPRPLNQYQADLDQFLDVPSRRRCLIATLPWGKLYAKQHPNGTQGQDYDIVTVNENSAFCGRWRMERRQLRSFIDRDGHELRIRRGDVAEDWPTVAEVTP